MNEKYNKDPLKPEGVTYFNAERSDHVEVNLDDFDFDYDGDYDTGMDPMVAGLLGTIDQLRAANKLLRWVVVALMASYLFTLAMIGLG